MTEVKPGQIYKHYKGDTYKVITLAKDSETQEMLVIYERQTNIVHKDWKIWSRPLKMFLETVEVAGKRVARFELIK